MSDEIAIQVHFGKPMPLFPLGVVALMPQQVAPFHIFEPRYRQMIGDALDGSGQIAMATYDTSNLDEFDYSGDTMPLRPAVCVGQVFQHERLPDGHYNILLQASAGHASSRKRAPTRIVLTALPIWNHSTCPVNRPSWAWAWHDGN